MFNFPPEMMQQLMQFVGQRFGPQMAQQFRQQFGNPGSTQPGMPPPVSAPMEASQQGWGVAQPPSFSTPQQNPGATPQPSGLPYFPSPPQQGAGGNSWARQGQRPSAGAEPSFSSMFRSMDRGTGQPSWGSGASSFGGMKPPQPGLGLSNLAAQPPTMPGIR